MNQRTPSEPPIPEEAVRRALADAGGPVPIPPDVAARIDAALAEAAAERDGAAAHPESPVVVPLDGAAHRRRRRVRLLVAAAAVVAVGTVGAGLISDRSHDDLTAAQLSQEDSAREKAAGAQSSLPPDALAASSATPPDAPQAAPEAGGVHDQAAPPPDALRRVTTDQPLREVRATNLREDLVALQHLALPDPRAADYTGTVLAAPADFTCDPAHYGPGHLVGVQYDGHPAVVAFRAPAGSTQVAEVLACGTGDVLHSTTLAATG